MKKYKSQKGLKIKGENVMNMKEYKDKVKGCWLGKNIGGTLGAPFEGWRGVFDVEYYTQDLTDLSLIHI